MKRCIKSFKVSKTIHLMNLYYIVTGKGFELGIFTKVSKFHNSIEK